MTAKDLCHFYTVTNVTLRTIETAKRFAGDTQVGGNKGFGDAVEKMRILPGELLITLLRIAHDHRLYPFLQRDITEVDFDLHKMLVFPQLLAQFLAIGHGNTQELAVFETADIDRGFGSLEKSLTIGRPPVFDAELINKFLTGVFFDHE